MNQAMPEQIIHPKKNKQPKLKLLSDKNGKFARFREQYGYLFLAALIPMVLMYLIYLARGIHPFGDGSVLVLDLTGQYVFFYEALRDILQGGASLFYSFSRALGGEFLGIFDYYVASPFAAIVGLFPEGRMLEALLCLFLLKTGLCGFNMAFYLHKHSETHNKISIITFSVMYALTSYAVVQQHNSMWIDAVLWLPLLVLGIEELIKHGKFRLFVFTLAITLFSNFYIGYMVCIFTVAYCFYYYFAHNRNNENNPTGEKNHFVRSIIRVACWALLAVGIAALAILSAKYALSFGKNEFSNPSWEISQKFDLFELAYKFLPSSYDTVRPEGLPFVYCGVLTIMLVPAFFLCKKFSNREKIAAAFMILFFAASFATSTLDLIWHGFQKPNWLNYRYSFLLCFFLIVLAFRAYEKIEFVSRKSLLCVVAFIGLFVLVLQEIGDFMTEANEKLVIRPFATIWLTLGCLFVYFIIICLRGKAKPRMKENLAIILAFLVCTEVFLSGLSEMNSLDDDVIYSGYGKYNQFLDTFQPIMETVEEYDSGFYRMEKTYHRKTNDNFALQMKGLSNSTSTLNRSTIDYLRNMGYSSKSHWSKYLGGTPVNDSLLGIKYLISPDDLSHYYGEPVLTTEDYGYGENFTPIDSKYCDVYYNPYALSFAYAVNDRYMAFDSDSYDSPFERLNAMITSMLGENETVEVFKAAIQNGEPELKETTGSENVYDNLDYYKYENTAKGKGSITYSYTVPANTELYFYYPTDYTREVKLKVNDVDKGTFGANETTRIISLGQVEATEMKLAVTLNNDSKNLYVMQRDSYVYYIDWEVFTDAMARLAESQFIIDDTSTDSHMTGTLTTDNANQLIYTSIPYDEGWNITVDGKRVDIVEADDALVAFYVEDAGTHDIEMKYMPSTVSLGLICSIVCLLIFVFILIAYRWLNRLPIIKHAMGIQAPDLPTVPSPEDRISYDKDDIGAPFKDDADTDPPRPFFKKANKEKKGQTDTQKAKSDKKSSRNEDRK